MIIAIDMDGTIADFVTAAIARCKELWGINIQYQEVTEYAFADTVKKKLPKNSTSDMSSREIYAAIYDKPRFFSDLEPLPGAIEGLKQIRQAGHTILIVSNALTTAKMPNQKNEWLDRYLKDIEHDRIFVNGARVKKYINCHVIIDDDPRVLENHLTAIPIAVVAPWNKEFRDNNFAGWSVTNMLEVPPMLVDINNLLSERPDDTYF